MIALWHDLISCKYILRKVQSIYFYMYYPNTTINVYIEQNTDFGFLVFEGLLWTSISISLNSICLLLCFSLEIRNHGVEFNSLRHTKSVCHPKGSHVFSWSINNSIFNSTERRHTNCKSYPHEILLQTSVLHNKISNMINQ